MPGPGFALIDFETTRLFPGGHDRVVEVVVVHADARGTITCAVASWWRTTPASTCASSWRSWAAQTAGRVLPSRRCARCSLPTTFCPVPDAPSLWYDC